MRQSIIVLAVVVITVTAGCAGLSQQSQPAEAPDATARGGTAGQTVAVGASGQVQTAPDRAVVEVAVTTRADTVEAVRQQLAANASQMRTALTDAGIASDQIVSSRFDIGRNFEARERPDAPAFRGEHVFVITLNDTERAGDVVVTAIQNGANEVQSVRFTISPETRRELRTRALANAVANGREKAEVLADGTELTLGEVITVRTSDVSVEPFQRQDLEFGDGGAGGGGVPTSFEGGKVTVTAHVSVVYNASSTTT